MSHRQLFSTAGMLAATAAAVALVSALAPAQDPFGAPMPKAGAPQAGGAPQAADPFGGAAQPGAAKPAAPAAVADPNKQEPLAIQILRDSNPKTPAELMQAAQTTLRFGRPDESKRYLGLLLAAKPADDALA